MTAELIRFYCPSCNKRVKAPTEAAGRAIRCPKCGESLVIPHPEESAAESLQRKAFRAPVAVAADSGPDQPDLPAVEPAEDDGPPVGKRELVESEMDMTPMVDVTFLLLIFFMVTASFALQKSIEVPKPKQDEASTNVVQQDPEQDPDFVTVTVDEFNTYRVVTIDWETECPSEQELMRKLREARQGDTAGNIPTKLLVKAHVESLHEKVVAALDAGTEVGMEQVQLMTVEDLE